MPQILACAIICLLLGSVCRAGDDGGDTLEKLRAGWRPQCQTDIDNLDLLVSVDGYQALLEIAKGGANCNPTAPISIQDPRRGHLAITKSHEDPDHPGGLVLDEGHSEPLVYSTYLLLECESRLFRVVDRVVFENALAWAADKSLPPECRVEAIRMLRWQIECVYSRYGPAKRCCRSSDFLIPDSTYHLSDTDLQKVEMLFQRIESEEDGSSPRIEEYKDLTVPQVAKAECSALRLWGDLTKKEPHLPGPDQSPDEKDEVIAAVLDGKSPAVDRLRLLDRLAGNGEYGLKALLLLDDLCSHAPSSDRVEYEIPPSMGNEPVQVEVRRKPVGKCSHGGGTKTVTFMRLEILRTVRHIMSLRVLQRVERILMDKTAPVECRLEALSCLELFVGDGVPARGVKRLSVGELGSRMGSDANYVDVSARRHAHETLEALAADSAATCAVPELETYRGRSLPDEVKALLAEMDASAPDGGW